MGTDDGDGDDGPLTPTGEQPDGRDAKTGRFEAGNRLGFQPGQSGNPSGRVRGMKAIFTQAFNELADEQADPKRAEQLRAGPVNLAKALIIEALGPSARGKVQALREALDRSVGKVPQPFRIALPDEEEERASFTDLRIRVVTREDVERERKRRIASGNGDDPSEDDVPE